MLINYFDSCRNFTEELELDEDEEEYSEDEDDEEDEEDEDPDEEGQDEGEEDDQEDDGDDEDTEDQGADAGEDESENSDDNAEGDDDYSNEPSNDSTSAGAFGLEYSSRVIQDTDDASRDEGVGHVSVSERDQPTIHRGRRVARGDQRVDVRKRDSHGGMVTRASRSRYSDSSGTVIFFP